MMTDEERRLIDTLFDRLAEAERRLPLRDADAEAAINKRLTSQPIAPYYMAQAMLVQEQALQNAQSRIAQLEQDVQQARQNSGAGGFLSGLFGGGRQAPPPPPSRPSYAAPSYVQPAYGQPGSGQPAYGQQPYPQGQGGPWGGGYGQARGGGGGFLAGAAQTAMGVAGGVLLADFIGDMFSGGHGAAAAGMTEINEVTNIYEAPAADNASNDVTDADYTDPGMDDFGGDWDSTEL